MITDLTLSELSDIAVIKSMILASSVSILVQFLLFSCCIACTSLPLILMVVSQLCFFVLLHTPQNWSILLHSPHMWPYAEYFLVWWTLPQYLYLAYCCICNVSPWQGWYLSYLGCVICFSYCTAFFATY